MSYEYFVFLDKITEWVDQGEVVDVVFLDFAVSPALSILQLNMKGLSVAFYSTRIINKCPVVWVIGRKLELAE